MPEGETAEEESEDRALLERSIQDVGQTWTLRSHLNVTRGSIQAKYRPRRTKTIPKSLQLNICDTKWKLSSRINLHLLLRSNMQSLTKSLLTPGFKTSTVYSKNNHGRNFLCQVLSENSFIVQSVPQKKKKTKLTVLLKTEQTRLLIVNWQATNEGKSWEQNARGSKQPSTEKIQRSSGGFCFWLALACSCVANLLEVISPATFAHRLTLQIVTKLLETKMWRLSCLTWL